MTLALILSTAAEEDRSGGGKPDEGQQDEEHAVEGTPAKASRGTHRREYERRWVIRLQRIYNF
jgi:hypothetical protein